MSFGNAGLNKILRALNIELLSESSRDKNNSYYFPTILTRNLFLIIFHQSTSRLVFHRAHFGKQWLFSVNT